MQRKMLRMVVVALSLIAVLSLGTIAAENTLQQVVRPDGVGLVLTGINVSQEGPYEGFDVGMWMITPDFAGTAEAKGLASTVLVVEKDVVSKVLTTEGGVLPTVPTVPADGYVLVGSGMAHSFLAAFQVGDKVQVINKERGASLKPALVITFDGSSHPVSAVNRGRRANELIVYTQDFGTHTLTNNWGTEAAVVDSQVVAIRPYNDNGLFEIPEGGFVISVHGSARTWFETNIRIGTLIEIAE